MYSKLLLAILLILVTVSVSTGATYCPDTGEYNPGMNLSAADSQNADTADENADRDVNSWSGAGPWGGNVRCLTTDSSNPMHVFAACGSSLTAVEGGVYMSTDGGANWQPTTLPRKAYNSVAASASQFGVFYAGARNGLYRSLDYGLTWEAYGQPSSYILGLGVQANNGNVIVMGKSSNTGILVSTDAGNTFNAVGVNSGFMRQFTWSAAEPGRMYVVMGSSTASVLTSTDNGQTWTPFGPAGDGWGMYISPTDSQFALIAHASGIYRTTDGGANWGNVQGGVFRSVTGFNGAYYATANDGGIYRSNDQGLTWQPQNPAVPQSTWQCATASQIGALLGHWGGIFRVSDYSQPAEVSHYGLNLALVHGLAYYADTNELWGGAEGSGLYRSTDGGASWQQMVNGLGNWMVYELQPTNHQYYQSGRMLAGTLSGAYTSLDGGVTWSYVHFQGTQVSGCEVHPTNPDIFWLGSASGEIKYTTDGGQTFQTSTGGMFGFAPRLKVGRSSFGGLRLFLSYQGSATAVWYSDDGGASFVPSSGMESTTYQPMVAVRPLLGDQPQIVYASSNAGVYKSTDNGASYSLTGMSGFSWSVLAGPGTQVVSGKDNGVSYSSDEAATSTSLTQNLEASANIWQMVWGESTNQVFIALRTRGVMENRFNNTVYGHPTNLQYIPDDHEVTLSWTPVSGEPQPVSYTVWRDGYPLVSMAANFSGYVDNALVNGQEYQYWVSAVYADGVQTSATEVITACAYEPEHPPVTELTGYAMDGSVYLSWNLADTTWLVGFAVYRDGALLATTASDQMTYLDLPIAAGTYVYSVVALYINGESEPVSVTVVVTVSNDDSNAPAPDTELLPCQPNPFEEYTVLRFSLKEDALVKLTVCNIRGQVVQTLLSYMKGSGLHELHWNGSDSRGKRLPSGIYFVRMTAGTYTSPVRKLFLAK